MCVWSCSWVVFCFLFFWGVVCLFGVCVCVCVRVCVCVLLLLFGGGLVVVLGGICERVSFVFLPVLQAFTAQSYESKGRILLPSVHEYPLMVKRAMFVGGLGRPLWSPSLPGLPVMCCPASQGPPLVPITRD